MNVSIPIPALVLLNMKLRDNIRHAKLICHGYEDTRECTIAWDRVENIQKAIHVKREREAAEKVTTLENLQCEIDELACREYDV